MSKLIVNWLSSYRENACGLPTDSSSLGMVDSDSELGIWSIGTIGLFDTLDHHTVAPPKR